MNRTPEQWAQVKPDAFLDGSIVQARNVIEMMQQDIAALATSQARAEKVEKLLATKMAHISELQDIISAKGDEITSAPAALQSKEG